MQIILGKNKGGYRNILALGSVQIACERMNAEANSLLFSYLRGWSVHGPKSENSCEKICVCPKIVVTLHYQKGRAAHSSKSFCRYGRTMVHPYKAVLSTLNSPAYSVAVYIIYTVGGVLYLKSAVADFQIYIINAGPGVHRSRHPGASAVNAELPRRPGSDALRNFVIGFAYVAESE